MAKFMPGVSPAPKKPAPAKKSPIVQDAESRAAEPKKTIFSPYAKKAVPVPTKRATSTQSTGVLKPVDRVKVVQERRALKKALQNKRS